MIQPQFFDDRKRIRNPRRARIATKTRIVHNSRARYSAIWRVCGVLGVVLVALLGYVMLMSNMTSLTYSLAKAHHEREVLQQQTARLDERLSTLRSQERLAAVAAKLGMHEPQQFALVSLETAPAVREGSVPMLSSIAGWFGGGSPPALAR